MTNEHSFDLAPTYGIPVHVPVYTYPGTRTRILVCERRVEVRPKTPRGTRGNAIHQDRRDGMWDAEQQKAQAGGFDPFPFIVVMFFVFFWILQ